MSTEQKSDVKVGDPVWIFDGNSRHYADPTPEQKKAGTVWGTMIWRKCWKKCTIIGSSRTHWHVSGHYETVKILKKPESAPGVALFF